MDLVGLAPRSQRICELALFRIGVGFGVRAGRETLEPLPGLLELHLPSALDQDARGEHRDRLKGGLHSAQAGESRCLPANGSGHTYFTMLHSLYADWIIRGTGDRKRGGRDDEHRWLS